MTGLWVKAAVVGTSPHAFGQKGLVRSTRVVVFRVSFRRLALGGAGVGVGADSKERRFGGVSPGVAFALATAGERVGDFGDDDGLMR